MENFRLEKFILADTTVYKESWEALPMDLDQHADGTFNMN